MTFNRTNLELKHVWLLRGVLLGRPFNRTNLELKLL